MMTAIPLSVLSLSVWFTTEPGGATPQTFNSHTQLVLNGC